MLWYNDGPVPTTYPGPTRSPGAGSYDSFRQCMACGQKFNSCKTAHWHKHKCPNSKVVCIPEKAAVEKVSHPPLPAPPDKQVAPPAPHAPTAPSHSNILPAVTGVLQDTSDNHLPHCFQDLSSQTAWVHTLEDLEAIWSLGLVLLPDVWMELGSS